MNTLTAAPPTQELLLPLRPELRPLPKRLDPRRMPIGYRMRRALAPESQLVPGRGAAIGWSLAGLAVFAYSLAGSIQ